MVGAQNFQNTKNTLLWDLNIGGRQDKTRRDLV
jgi:hypothetical protein